MAPEGPHSKCLKSQGLLSVPCEVSDGKLALSDKVLPGGFSSAGVTWSGRPGLCRAGQGGLAGFTSPNCLCCTLVS